LKKLQQYYIFKISTTRLKNSNYNINLSVDEARDNSEIISLGDSQMLKSLRKIKEIIIDESYISELFLERKKIKRKSFSTENLTKIQEINKKIDETLFVPEIISIFVENKTDYKKISKNGFVVNNKKYVRFACGAGHARRNNALFIDEEYEEILKKVLSNDRDDIEITPAKYNAYFALSASATLSVPTPYFCVVPDKEVIRKEKVDFVKEIEGQDDEVEEQEIDITFNLWDGQGIISPKMAKIWADHLELDYVPSSFIVRSSFIKGLLVVIDFHKFSDEIGKRFIVDIYGNTVNIRDMDVILTQSQFKLWNAYSSISEYKKKSLANNFEWGISRVSPKEDKKHVFLNYQFIQVLDLNMDSIKRLCKQTIDYFNKIINSDIRYTLLYLLGKISNEEYDENILNKIHDKITKAIILNNKLLDDPYIKNNIIHSLNKKIKESYVGNILVDGCYTVMVSDPYAFLEYLFDLPIQGLLKRGEHYNKYWIDKKEAKLGAMRAPLTWKSEVNILNLKSDEKINEWYKYLNNCVVYNVFGNDVLLHADSDWDGDGVCITNNAEIINGASGGNPITYSTKKAPKVKIKEKDLYLSDLDGFNSKVGFVTNVATTAFAMLPMFDKDSLEYKELIKRLKCLRKEQGSTIDATKGLIIKPFPSHWTKKLKYGDNITEEEKKKIDFMNSITIEKRPYFMRWLYSSYNRTYNKYNNIGGNSVSMTLFNKSLDYLLEKYENNQSELSEEELEFIKSQISKSPFLETNSIMNSLCKYMESEIKEIKNVILNDYNDDLLMILKNNKIKTDREKLKKLYDLYKIYKSEKRNVSKYNSVSENKYSFKTIDQYHKHIRKLANEVSNDGSELANLAVDICYTVHKNDNKMFLWGVFGDDVLENIKMNVNQDVFVPFYDKAGDIEYLGNKYSMKKINVENKYYDRDLYDNYS